MSLSAVDRTMKRDVELIQESLTCTPLGSLADWSGIVRRP